MGRALCSGTGDCIGRAAGRMTETGDGTGIETDTASGTGTGAGAGTELLPLAKRHGSARQSQQQLHKPNGRDEEKERAILREWLRVSERV